MPSHSSGSWTDSR